MYENKISKRNIRFNKLMDELKYWGYDYKQEQLINRI